MPVSDSDSDSELRVIQFVRVSKVSVGLFADFRRASRFFLYLSVMAGRFTESSVLIKMILTEFETRRSYFPSMRT